MDTIEMNTEPTMQQEKAPSERNGLQPRRRIAKQMVERGQRLRSRAGVIIGLSLGLLALVSVLE